MDDVRFFNPKKAGRFRTGEVIESTPTRFGLLATGPGRVSGPGMIPTSGRLRYMISYSDSESLALALAVSSDAAAAAAAAGGTCAGAGLSV
jgi:hypothetical protein